MLTIIGILLSVAVPNFVRIGRRDNVQAAAYDMQRTLSLARQKALAKRTRYRVTVTPSAHTYQVDRWDSGTWVPDPSRVFEWHDDVTAVLHIGTGGNSDIEIEPQGTVAENDAPALFTFTNAHGDTARVSFVRTGRIRVQGH